MFDCISRAADRAGFTAMRRCSSRLSAFAAITPETVDAVDAQRTGGDDDFAVKPATGRAKEGPMMCRRLAPPPITLQALSYVPLPPVHFRSGDAMPEYRERPRHGFPRCRR